VWHSDQFAFDQLSVNGKGFDPMIFEVRAVKPPTPEQPFGEIEFEDGGKMVTTDRVSFQFRERELADSQAEVRNQRHYGLRPV